MTAHTEPVPFYRNPRGYVRCAACAGWYFVPSVLDARRKGWKSFNGGGGAYPLPSPIARRECPGIPV